MRTLSADCCCGERRQWENRAAHDRNLVCSVHPAAHSGPCNGRVLKLQRDALALRLDRVHLLNHSPISAPAPACPPVMAPHAGLALHSLSRRPTTRGLAGTAPDARHQNSCKCSTSEGCQLVMLAHRLGYKSGWQRQGWGC